MEINLRPWRRPDLDEIQRAWLAFCRSAARSDMQLRRNAEREMSEWLASRFRNGSSLGLIAERDAAMVGFLLGRIDDWESIPPIVEPRRIGIIDALYVKEDCRRQGIAAGLIRRALVIMKEQGAVAAETIYDAWSEAATETWRGAGFAPWMVQSCRIL